MKARQLGSTAKSMFKPVYRRYRRWEARRAVDASLEQATYTWDDLQRFSTYLDHAFKVRQPKPASPLQRPRRYFPELTAQPVWDHRQFPFVSGLVDGQQEILEELLGFRQREELGIHHQRLNDTGAWNVFYLFAGGEITDQAPTAFPRTLDHLTALPGVGVAGQAYFSVLAPGTHIPAHTGPTNTRLRVHVPLIVPPGSEMRIGDHLHRWGDGHQVLVFDDSFEHEVWVRSDQERIVLIVDIWHPELSAAERWALEITDALMDDRRRYRRGVHRKRQLPTRMRRSRRTSAHAAVPPG